MAAPTFSSGWMWTNSGRLRSFLRQDVGHQRLRRLRGEEAVVGHPLVVEDLGQVAAAAVGQQHDDDASGPAASATRSAAATAMPHEPPVSSASSRASRRVMRERLGVADRDDLVA